MGGNENGTNYNGDVPFTNGNFTAPNPAYWSKITTFFQLAEQYGITVFALPIDAYATEGGNVFTNMSNAQAKAFGQWLTSEYPPSAFPGIVWMIGNDYAGDGAGDGNGGFVSQYQNFIAGLGSARLVTGEQGYNDSLSTDGTNTGPLMTLNAAYDYYPTYEGVLRGWTTRDLRVLVV